MLQRPRFDFFRGMAGHTRNLCAENNPRVARLFYKCAALPLQSPSELARLHNLTVTIYGYRVKSLPGARGSKSGSVQFKEN